LAAAESAAEPGGEQAAGTAEVSRRRGTARFRCAPAPPRVLACSAAARRVFPVGDHVGQKPITAFAVLGQRLLAPVVAVIADGRRADQHPGPVARLGDQLGQPARRADPAVPDRGTMVIGETARDRLAREVDDPRPRRPADPDRGFLDSIGVHRVW